MVPRRTSSSAPMVHRGARFRVLVPWDGVDGLSVWDIGAAVRGEARSRVIKADITRVLMMDRILGVSLGLVTVGLLCGHILDDFG